MMLPDDIQLLAETLRNDGMAQMDLHELIRSIQFQQGRMPCYSEPWSAPCRVDDCPFSAVCTSHLRVMSVVRH
jgi:hypothetical protein